MGVTKAFTTSAKAVAMALGLSLTFAGMSSDAGAGQSKSGYSYSYRPPLPERREWTPLKDFWYRNFDKGPRDLWAATKRAGRYMKEVPENVVESFECLQKEGYFIELTKNHTSALDPETGENFMQKRNRMFKECAPTGDKLVEPLIGICTVSGFCEPTGLIGEIAKEAVKEDAENNDSPKIKSPRVPRRLPSPGPKIM